MPAMSRRNRCSEIRLLRGLLKDQVAVGAIVLFFAAGASARPRARRSVVCWNGPPLEWGGEAYSYNLRQGKERLVPEAPDVKIEIIGRGCQRCVVGRSCGFLLTFSNGTIFDERDFKEVTAVLTGPSRSSAFVSHKPLHLWGATKGVNFQITYRVWDEGIYSLLIEGDCTWFNNTKASIKFARIPIQVMPPLSEVEGEQEEENSEKGRATPCDESVYGRWYKPRTHHFKADEPTAQESLPNASTEQLAPAESPQQDEKVPADKTGMDGQGVGDAQKDKDKQEEEREALMLEVNPPEGPGPDSPDGFQWKWFSCAGNVSSAAAMAENLLEKGISEIVFQGDSHSERLFKQISFLISGGPVNREHQTDMAWSWTSPSSKLELTMKFQWLPGISPMYSQDCWRPVGYSGLEQLPVFSPTADFVILNSAHWELMGCARANAEYAKHLIKYFDWIKSLPRKETTKIVWRSAPPYRVKDTECSLRRNSALFWANEYARSLAGAYGFFFLDTWHVEAPRHDEQCFVQGSTERDTHYSCAVKDFTEIRGVVGEATAMNILFKLTKLLDS